MISANVLSGQTATAHQRAAVLCIPHAGAGASTLFGFRAGAPSRLRTGIVRFSGRESRANEPASVDPQEQLADVVAAGRQLAGDLPLVLMGHCSGARLALAAVDSLRGAGLDVVAVVAVSAPPPTVHVPFDAGMSDQSLLERLARSGDVSADLLSDPEMAELLVPQLRGDFMVQSRLCAVPVCSLPILVLRGDRDRRLDARTAERWQAWAPRVQVREVAGNHFLAIESVQEVWAAVSEFLAPLGV